MTTTYRIAFDARTQEWSGYVNNERVCEFGSHPMAGQDAKRWLQAEFDFNYNERVRTVWYPAMGPSEYAFTFVQ